MTRTTRKRAVTARRSTPQASRREIKRALAGVGRLLAAARGMMAAIEPAIYREDVKKSRVPAAAKGGRGL